MTGGASFIACGINQPIFEKANLFDILGVGVPQPCFYSKNMSALNAGPRLVDDLGDPGAGEGERCKVGGRLGLHHPRAR